MHLLSNFRRVAAYYRDHARATAIGSAAVVASALIGLQAPGIVRRAVDLLSAGAPLAAIWRQAALIALIAAGSGYFLYLQRRLLVGVSREIEHRLRTDLYRHLLRLPPAFFMRERVGDVLTRATSDVGAVRLAVGPALMYTINTVTVMLLASILMARIHLPLTLLALCVVPLVAGATRVLGTRIHTRWGRSQEELSRYTARLQEHLVGLRVLRAYGCEGTEKRAMAELSRAYLVAGKRLISVSSLFHPILQALIGLAFVIVLGVGGSAVRAGTITLGQFVEFNLYVVRLTWPMIAVGWVANLLQRGAASSARIEALFAEQVLDEPAAQDGAVGSPRTGPARLELCGLSFTYPGSPKPALDGVSLVAAPGQRIALVGEVASGKSTVLSIIPRLLEPPRGAVLLDGRDVLDLPLLELRGGIALVPQGSFLFSATLRDNIALARPDAGADEVLAAARAAGLGDDLERFPAGLDTVVGERGVTLSGGQRQRVAIARALITRPRLLLLDDCLSAVDTATERQILEALPDTTLLFATHRLAAAELCDRVVVLDDGRVVEAGTPAELAARGGRYARLLALQRLDERPALPAAAGA
ncbi:MAG: ABC-type multidrug transport system, ATPase and permease component [Acidobacteria bacterium]|nr:ABC-type multidrug transport system, ATPase and permease component [Acidobacteriota bacterium]